MNDRFDASWTIFPDFGRIQHLPHKPNTDRGDLVATPAEVKVIFDTDLEVVVEDKVDGSQVAMYIGRDGVPVVRNKNHVLVKGYGRKGTPAKAQYAPLWNWATAHADNFAELYAACRQVVGVYGEWIYAEHTLRYDRAPDDFIAYEIYLPLVGSHLGYHLSPLMARAMLLDAGFHVPEILVACDTVTYSGLEALTKQPSVWSTQDLREGVMVKVGDGSKMLHRFKMRREDFQPRQDFNDTPLRRRVRP